MFSKKSLIPDVKSMTGVSWKKVWFVKPLSHLDWKSLIIKGLIFCCTLALLFALVITIKPFLTHKSFGEPKKENTMQFVPVAKNVNFTSSNDTANSSAKGELLTEETNPKLSDSLHPETPVEIIPEGISTQDNKGDSKIDSASTTAEDTMNSAGVDAPNTSATKTDDTLHPGTTLPVPIEVISTVDKNGVNSSTKSELPQASGPKPYDSLHPVLGVPAPTESKSNGIKDDSDKNMAITVIDVTTNSSAETDSVKAPNTKTYDSLHSGIVLPAPVESTSKGVSTPTTNATPNCKGGDLNASTESTKIEPISLPNINSTQPDVIHFGNQTSIIDNTKENTVPIINLESDKTHKSEKPSQSDALPGLSRGSAKIGAFESKSGKESQAEEIQELHVGKLDEPKANTKADISMNDDLPPSKKKHKSGSGKHKATSKTEADMTTPGASAEDDLSIIFPNFPMGVASIGKSKKHEGTTDEPPKKKNANVHPDKDFGRGTNMNLLKTNEECFCGLYREECSCPSDINFCESCTYESDHEKTALEQFLSDLSGFFERFPWQDDFRNFGDIIKQNTERFFHRVTPW